MKAKHNVLPVYHTDHPQFSRLLLAGVVALVFLNVIVLRSSCSRWTSSSSRVVSGDSAKELPSLMDLVETPQPLSAMYRSLLPHKVLQVGSKTVLVHDAAGAPGGEAYWTQVNSSTWEPETFAAFNSCITQETTVIDFGSWIGPTIMWAVALGAKQVVSFEPDPVAYAALTLNMQLNGFSNVHMHHACVAPKAGTLPLYFRGGNSISSTYKMAHGADNAEGYADVLQVPCFTLDHVIQHYGLHKAELFIKIDTEGFEKELVPVLKGLFRRYRPSVHLSIHGSLTTISDMEWSSMADALSVFPIAYKHAGGTSFSRVAPGSLYDELRRDGKSNHEMVFTWSGRCSSLG